MDRYLVISADGHAGPPAEVYRDYLDPSFRKRFDEHQRATEEMRAAFSSSSGTRSDFEAQWEADTGGDGGLTAAYDSDARNAVLDDEGVAAEVLFPDADVLGTGRVASSPFGTGLAGASGNVEEAIAGSRAHNRWLGDFVAQEPRRRIGVAVVPAIIPDMDQVLALVREAKELGHGGILVPTRWFDRPAYHDMWYEPLWTLAEELELVVHTHSGAGPTDIGMGPGMLPIYASEAGWWAARPLGVLIWGGVFERHPNLKYAMAENGAWWVPDQIRKMDEKWIGGHNTRKFGNAFRETLSMKPSDYLDRNCFFAVSSPQVDDMERRGLVGIGNMMWGNDLPHPEGTFPFTRYWIRERFHDVDRDEARRILGENAAEVYGVDIERLQPLVDRIGPTFEQVHGDVPVDRVPAGV